MYVQAAKALTANDLGLSGSHQAGICVPRKAPILELFPVLPSDVKNPRAVLRMVSEPSGTQWEFQFIYYNNSFFGGTRNEYRLTGTTALLRELRAEVGDEIVFERRGARTYRTWLERAGQSNDAGFQFSNSGALILGGGWKVVNLK